MGVELGVELDVELGVELEVELEVKEEVKGEVKEEVKGRVKEEFCCKFTNFSVMYRMKKLKWHQSAKNG